MATKKKTKKKKPVQASKKATKKKSKKIAKRATKASKKPSKGKKAVKTKKAAKVPKKSVKGKKGAKKILKKALPKAAAKGAEKKSKAGKVKMPKKKEQKILSRKEEAIEQRDRANLKLLEVLNLDNRVQRQKDVAWRMIDGEAVIITQADSAMHTLNDVGTRIWELITGSRTLNEVADVLCSEFEVDKERARKDTLWFVECLAKKGLVELAEKAS